MFFSRKVIFDWAGVPDGTCTTTYDLRLFLLTFIWIASYDISTRFHSIVLIGVFYVFCDFKVYFCQSGVM